MLCEKELKGTIKEKVTAIIKIFDENPNEKEIDKVVKVLKKGGLIIYPTDTVYSMGCDSRNVKAVEKLCKLKNVKPSQNRFSIVCSDLSDISVYAKVPNVAFRLMKKLLPGPYTFILQLTLSPHLFCCYYCKSLERRTISG